MDPVEDQHVRHECPRCHATNVVACGDVEDLTSSMGEAPACVCWNCGHKFWRIDPNNKDEIDILESEDQWDAAKSIEENLAEADAEEGDPSEFPGSSGYERFLESPCPLAEGQTWRGFVLQQLYFLNHSKPFWSEPRRRRIELVEQYLREPNIFRKKMAQAFHAAGIYCRKLSFEKPKKNGGAREAGFDWVNFYRKTKSLLLYMTGIGWYEIKHDDRPNSGAPADGGFKPPVPISPF